MTSSSLTMTMGKNKHYCRKFKLQKSLVCQNPFFRCLHTWFSKYLQLAAISLTDKADQPERVWWWQAVIWQKNVKNAKQPHRAMREFLILSPFWSFLIPILSRRTEVDHQAKSWPLLAKKKPPGCPKSGSDTNVPVFKSVASPHH